MFDFKRTLALIKGAIFDPETTWDGYLPEASDWKKTAALLTGPLVVASGVLGYLVDFVFPNRNPFIPDTGFLDMLLGIVMAAVAAVVVAFVFAFLAGLFKGKNSFALSLAATSLAFVPGYIGNVLVHVPWLGWLLSLALGIYGLVLLWRILPRYLEVPAGSRIGHFILSLVTCIVAFFIIGTVFGVGMMGSRSSGFDAINMSQPAGDSAGGSTGAFAGLERHGKIMEAAQEDAYDPPRSGKLSESQVREFVQVLSKTRDYRMSQAQRLEELSEKAEKNDIASVGAALSGMAGVVNISNAEMEVVKTGGGNWAEHQWVREQLHVARIQKDINPAVEHNYQLYLAFEDELGEAGF